MPTKPIPDSISLHPGYALIVSGDRDLLSLKLFSEIQIVRAAQAVKLLAGT